MSQLQRLLLGGQGTVSVERVLSGLSLDLALRPLDGLPYTLYGLLWHTEFCQRQLLLTLGGEEVRWPPAAEQWPQGTPSQEEFADVLEALKAGLYEASELANDAALDPRSGALGAEEGADLETLADLAVHNAYHWGQVVMLRRLLGDWPPAEVREGASA